MAERGPQNTGDVSAHLPLLEARKLFSMPHLASDAEKVALFPGRHSVIIDTVRMIAQGLWVRKTHLLEKAGDRNN